MPISTPATIGLLVEQHQRATQEGSAYKSVLPMTQIDEYGRVGERDEHRHWPRDNGPHGYDIRRESGRHPYCEGPTIGHERENRGDEQEQRRIVPAVEGHVLPAEQPLLDRVLGCPVVSGVRLTSEGQCASGIDVGKIGAERLVIAIDHSMRERDPGHRADDIGCKENSRVTAQSRRGQPRSGPELAPDGDHVRPRLNEDVRWNPKARRFNTWLASARHGLCDPMGQLIAPADWIDRISSPNGPLLDSGVRITTDGACNAAAWQRHELERFDALSCGPA